MITENLSTLKIHKLTQAQYDRELEAGNIDENALYLTPDTTTNVEVDATLIQSGAAADAKVVGDKFATLIGNTPVSEQISHSIAEIPKQIQSDWNQNDETATNYIKNKPSLATSEEIKALFN